MPGQRRNGLERADFYDGASLDHKEQECGAPATVIIVVIILALTLAGLKLILESGSSAVQFALGPSLGTRCKLRLDAHCSTGAQCAQQPSCGPHQRHPLASARAKRPRTDTTTMGPSIPL